MDREDERREHRRQKKAARKAERAKVREEQQRVRATVKFLRRLARQGGNVNCQSDPGSRYFPHSAHDIS